MIRAGQNYNYNIIYTVYIRYLWQGNHQIYGHIRCIYTVLAILYIQHAINFVYLGQTFATLEIKIGVRCWCVRVHCTLLYLKCNLGTEMWCVVSSAVHLTLEGVNGK